MAKISVDEDLHEVMASGDGSAASIANTVNGTAHEINVIDLKNLNPEKQALMSCTPNNYISVIDLATMEVIKPRISAEDRMGLRWLFKSSRASFPINSDLLFLNEE